jgi:hypothetical protein
LDSCRTPFASEPLYNTYRNGNGGAEFQNS